MPESNTAYFHAGVVTGFHGLRGDLKVKLLSGEPETLLHSRQVRMVVAGQDPSVYPVVVARRHKDRVLLRLKGLESLSLVEHLKGAEIHCLYEDLVELEADDYYWYQIEGMRVVDRTLGELGNLDSYFTTAAHDTWVVTGRFGEVLIPAVGRFFIAIDLEEKQITVDLPEGLVEVNAP